MKIKFTLLFILFYFSLSSQLTSLGLNFDHNYITLLKNKLALQTLITVSSPKGKVSLYPDLIKSNYILMSDFDIILSNALFQYNLYGKKISFSFLDSLANIKAISNEDKLLTKIYLSIYSNNYEDYLNLKSNYINQYFNPLNNIKFEIEYLRRNTHFIHDNDEKFKNISIAIDSQLKVNSLKNEDKAFLNLAKCITLFKKPIDSTFSILINTWENYKEFLNKEMVVSSLSSCELDKCNKIIQEIENMDKLKNKISSEDELINTLVEFDGNDKNNYSNKTKIKMLESKIISILNNEKIIHNKEKLKFLIYGICSEEGKYMMKGQMFYFQDLNIPSLFTNDSILKTNYTKIQLIDSIQRLINNFNINKTGSNSLSEINSNLKMGNIQDLSKVYGVLIYFNSIIKSIEKLKKISNSELFGKISYAERNENWDSYFEFLDKNPLCEYSGYGFYTPDINSKKQFVSVSNKLGKIIKKYPGSLSLQKIRHHLNLTYGPKHNDTGFLREFIFSTIDLLCLSQEESIYSSESIQKESIYQFLGLNDYSTKKLVKLIYGRFSKITKIELEEYLNNKINEYPNENLYELKAIIVDYKNIKKDKFELFIDATKRNLNISFDEGDKEIYFSEKDASEIDSQYLTSQLASISRYFIENNFTGNLHNVISLLFYTKQWENAISVIKYSRKNLRYFEVDEFQKLQEKIMLQLVNKKVLDTNNIKNFLMLWNQDSILTKNVDIVIIYNSIFHLITGNNNKCYDLLKLLKLDKKTNFNYYYIYSENDNKFDINAFQKILSVIDEKIVTTIEKNKFLDELNSIYHE